jgi:hypothetical protein
MRLIEPRSAVSMMGYNLFRALRQLAVLSLTAVMAFVAVPVLMHPGYLAISAAAKSGGSGGAGRSALLGYVQWTKSVST